MLSRREISSLDGYITPLTVLLTGEYDGSMTARAREEELESFRSDPLKTVCLVSLRAGAYGLNLTCASQCVILDPFWNPFVEAQAIDRIHRIGQSRVVKVHRIVVEGTVEDRILQLQDQVRRPANHSLWALCSLVFFL